MQIFAYFSGGEFSTIIELPEGEHQFKFLVDGHWVHNPQHVSQQITDAISKAWYPLRAYWAIGAYFQ